MCNLDTVSLLWAIVCESVVHKTHGKTCKDDDLYNQMHVRFFHECIQIQFEDHVHVDLMSCTNLKFIE